MSGIPEGVRELTLPRCSVDFVFGGHRHLHHTLCVDEPFLFRCRGSLSIRDARVVGMPLPKPLVMELGSCFASWLEDQF